ncbi:hypothetical protein SCP_0604420 [Sparassis crispa]|uniref:Eisosome component PIL1-domain-containing protein n=1 Tax=Sparassis crispa TaxID=139825 RepID=A0A401GQG1_9APHY|nr:hypothetical protein SCP_0604420 [Sparassis crispa]GBE84463.1 hypothetical protein SCP_0604420 [Sparassis crispa]
MFKKIAHNTTVPALGGNRDLRTLQDLITAEKGVLNSLHKLSSDLTKASEALKVWGLGEGDDLGDILSASTVLFNHFTASLTTFASHEVSVREHMKALRTREESLDELRRRRKAHAAKADSADKKLAKMNPDNKNLQGQRELVYRLQEEIRIMDTDIMAEEASLSDFKRSTTKMWMGLKFGGLLECSNKGVIVGEIGLLVIEEIPLETTEPGLPRAYYQGRSRTGSLIAEAQTAVSSVQFPSDPYQQTLTEYRTSGNSLSEQSPILPPPQRRQPAMMDNPPVGGIGSPPLHPMSMPLPTDRPRSTTSSRLSQGPISPTNTGFSGYPPGPQGNFSADSPVSPSPHMPQPDIYPSVTNEFGAIAPGQFSARSSSVRNPDERERAGGPRGARFATFPTKVGGPRSPHAPPQEGDRPPSLDVNAPEDDFSSSVAAALSQQWQLDGEARRASMSTRKPPPHVKSDDYSHSTYTSPPPLYSPHDLPPGAAPPQSQYGGTWNSPVIAPHEADPSLPPPREGAEEESYVGLAYMSGQHIGSEPSLAGVDRGDKRVKFESGREETGKLDTDMGAQIAEAAPKLEVATHLQPAEGAQIESPIAESHQEADPHHSPISDHPPSPRVPLPEHDNQSLHAAAAREVSRELDALMLNGATPRAPSPLLPPQAPFSRRAVSPRPEMENSSSQPTSPRLEYIRERSRAMSSSASSGDPTGHISEPRFTGERDAPLPAPGIKVSNIPSPTSSSISTNPYRASPEHSPAVGTSQPTSSFYNLSAVSGSNPVLGTGARTIPASAFRRPRAPTSPATDSGGSSGAATDISPLVVKKRPLPPSPHPAAPGVRIPSAPFTSQYTQSAVDPRFRSVSAEPGPGGGLASHQTVPAQPPSYGEVQGAEEEDEYDFVGAYAQSSHPPPAHRTEAEDPRQSGLGHVRSAANMDRDGHEEGLR